MMWHRRFSIVLLSVLVLLVLTPARTVHAAPIQGDEVTMGEDVTLREGERISGELVVIGGDLTMREGSRVDGNATVVGGEAWVNGAVAGDLVAVGGNVTLGDQARVEGDVVALGGRVERAEGAQTGSVIQGPALGNIRFWRDLSLPLFRGGVGIRPGSAIGSTVSALGSAVILALIGMAVYTFWPTQTNEVGRTIVSAPLPSLGIGCLVFPLAAILGFFILITICLAPFVPVVALLVVAASLFGWIALGMLLGRWLAQATGWRTAAPTIVAGVGVFSISIVAAVLNAIPCLGTLLVLCAASIGLGAVVLSRFGTRRHGTPVAKAPVPAGPSAPAPAVEEIVPSGVPEDSIDAAIREAVASPAATEPTAAAQPEETAPPSVPEDSVDAAIREAVARPTTSEPDASTAQADVEPSDDAEPPIEPEEPAGS